MTFSKPFSPDYPRPHLRRDDFLSLDGSWDFAFDSGEEWNRPSAVAWDRRITVPFAPETELSGINDGTFHPRCWYRREFFAPAMSTGQRMLLHFEAVDYQATVWVNDVKVGQHEGGYTPFTFDITDCLSDGEQTVAVLAEDDPNDLEKPRGKQDWQLDAHAIWYPRTSGIWRTVWLESVPETSIGSARWDSSLEHWEIGLEVELDGVHREDLSIRVRLASEDIALADDTYALLNNPGVYRRISLGDPGIDDYRNEFLWSPVHPTLIDASIQLLDSAGQVLDEVWSYTALRSVGAHGDRFLLNGRPIQLRMVLDQGYWPESGLTAPNSEALRRDVELVKAMGFNGVRKHQKIEDPRYLYWADRLGLLVWEEMPSAYRFTARAIDRTVREWMDVLRRDSGHPSIVAWVPFNESWGVPDLPYAAPQRHYVRTMYELTKTIDPERPVVGNDGWEALITDIVGVHDYDEDSSLLRERYGSTEDLAQALDRAMPAGRRLGVEGHEYAGQPVILSEFGGISWSTSDEAWGYTRASSPEDLQDRYVALLETVHLLTSLAGFCYTQFADTYQEANGLLHGDRTPKFPIEVMREATMGPKRLKHEQMETEWALRKAKQRLKRQD